MHRAGVIAAQKGDLAGAQALIRDAIALQPGNPVFHVNLGNVLAQLRRPAEAIASYDKAIALKPDLAEAWCNRGSAQQSLGEFEAAVASFDRALALRPGFTGAQRGRGIALFSLGAALLGRGEVDAAVACLSQVVQLDPRSAAAHYNLGNARVAQGRLETALEDYERALALDPQHGQACYNRGHVLQQLGQYEAALESYDRAISIDPASADAYNNRGNVNAHLGRITEAVADFERAMQVGPGLTDARYNCALALLKGGDLARGWELHEDRWNRIGGAAQVASRNIRYAADWDGQPMKGHLLVLAEQGLGDEIFYCGMLSDLRPRVGRLTVELDVRLHELFCRSFPDIDFVARGRLDPGTSADAQVYMGSLGRYLRNRTEALDNVRVPYLVADAARASALRARLGSAGKRICGLSWISKNPTIGASKSLRLADLRPLLERPEASFVDLQYGDTRAEQEALTVAADLRLQCVEEIDNFDDLDGLAALIAACDVVISVSNTTAHLAAALGKTVYLLLPSATETLWYWHVAETRSPWYPTARLFRQARGGDWSGVVSRVGENLDGQI